jgi:DNA-binding MarR family transcriptional regulator
MTGLDRVIHEPARLRIMMTLSATDLADHAHLCSTLGLTKGNLSSHVSKLERSGYVEVVKSFTGKIPHTDYLLTDTGREALRLYLDALEDIMALAVARGTTSLDRSLLAGAEEVWEDSEKILQAS